MNVWDWEAVGRFFKDGEWAISDSGMLLGPVLGFSVSRNEDLQLRLEARSEAEPVRSDAQRHGEVYVSGESVSFTHLTEVTAIAQGLVRRGVNTTIDRGGRVTTIETLSAHSIAFTSKETDDTAYVIDWLGNMAHSFLWPHSSEETSVTSRSRAFRGLHSDVTATLTHEARNFGKSCASIRVRDVELFVGVVDKRVGADARDPGFILYKGNPDDSTRSKIRDCLRFCLGLNLIYLGHTALSDSWRLVSFEAVSPNVRPHDVKNVLTLPAAPLGARYEWQIDPNILEPMVNALFDRYDDLGLSNVFWSYWHAAAAPMHMSAAHIGALIEKMRKSYAKYAGDQFSTIVVDKRAWKALSAKLSECVKNAEITHDEKKFIGNRILSQLNTAPQGVLLDRFLSALGIDIDTVERSAWVKRNAAAHGDSIAPEKAIETIRLNKALLTLANRIVLAMTKSHTLYYDYYTIGRPIRLLEHAIANDARDSHV